MFKIELQWKEFNIDCRAVNAHIVSSYGPNCVGTQSAASFEVWFEEEPSQEDKDAIQAYWDAIESDSEEATSYQSAEELKAASDAARAAAAASAAEKLAILGLTEEEIAALIS